MFTAALTIAVALSFVACAAAALYATQARDAAQELRKHVARIVQTETELDALTVVVKKLRGYVYATDHRDRSRARAATRAADESAVAAAVEDDELAELLAHQAAPPSSPGKGH